MLPSLDYIKTLINGVIQYTKNADKELKKDIAAEIKDNAPDWEQNDPTGKGYIANRPCYKEVAATKRVLHTWGGEFSPPLGLVKGETYLFGPKEEPTDTYICKDAHDENSSYPVGTLYVGNLNGSYAIFDDNLYTNPGWSHMVGSSIWAISGPLAVYHSLDNAYISDDYRDIIESHKESTTYLQNGSESASVQLFRTGSKATAVGAVSLGGYANGVDSLSSGSEYTKANGRGSTAFGRTMADSDYMLTAGSYNKTTEGLFVVGRGNGNSSRKDAFTLDADGNAWFSGEVYIGSTNGITKDSGSKKLITEESIPTKTSQLTNDSGYLTEHQSLDAYAKKTEIPTVPTTDSELSATSTNPVQNKIIKAELDKKLESIPVDGTTIKLNDEGKLTLALGNANGVSF